MTNYVGRALYENEVDLEKNKYKFLDADRAISFFEKYNVPISANKEETDKGIIYGPFQDGSYILSTDQGMFSVSSKDKIDQLFLDITFASYNPHEEKFLSKIDRPKPEPKKTHNMLMAWENNIKLYSLLRASVMKALSDVNFNIEHIMENITNHIQPNEQKSLLALLNKIKEVGNVLRNNKFSPPEVKQRVARRQYSTQDGFSVVVNYNPKEQQLRVSTILSPKEVFVSNDDDGLYNPEFLDLIQSGGLGINACPKCLGIGCEHCQNGIMSLSPEQEAFLRSFVKKQVKASLSPISEWTQAFSQLKSMAHNFNKLQKVSWTISDDKLNMLFQELLPLFVKYAMVIRNSSQDLLDDNQISIPMVESANKIINELANIFNLEV